MKLLRSLIGQVATTWSRNRRVKAAAEENKLLCEKCGHTTDLASVPPLDFAPCPKCGFKNYVPLRLDDFLLVEPIGAGGFSSVYKAVRLPALAELCAVKLLRPEAGADARQRDAFLFEAHVHHAVGTHRNIVTFYGSGDTNGYLYHAMAFVPGDNVRSRTKAKGRIPEAQALEWSIQTCEALQHIVKHGYLYRDVSPGNLLIDAANQVVLVDFGLALPLEEADAAQSETFVEGTAEYIPPERVQHLGEDERSVIYSLGHLLAFMLKGEPLVRASTQQKLALQHVAALRVAFSDAMLPSDIRPATVDLIGRMIKADPAQRPPSLDAVHGELERLIGPT